MNSHRFTVIIVLALSNFSNGQRTEESSFGERNYEYSGDKEENYEDPKMSSGEEQEEYTGNNERSTEAAEYRDGMNMGRTEENSGNAENYYQGGGHQDEICRYSSAGQRHSTYPRIAQEYGLACDKEEDYQGENGKRTVESYQDSPERHEQSNGRRVYEEEAEEPAAGHLTGVNYQGTEGPADSNGEPDADPESSQQAITRLCPQYYSASSQGKQQQNEQMRYSANNEETYHEKQASNTQRSTPSSRISKDQRQQYWQAYQKQPQALQRLSKQTSQAQQTIQLKKIE